MDIKRVKYKGREKMDFIVRNNDIDLVPGKEYEVLSIEREWYRVIDESGEDYLYPPDFFEIVN